MDDGQPDEFVVSAVAPIDPSTEFEGTNASRFAILGMLSITTPAIRESPFHVQTLERFGIPRGLYWHGERTNQASFDTFFAEVDHLMAIRRRLDPDLARAEAWERIVERGDATARLSLLAAGLCSHLERESVAAAVALMGAVRVAPSLWWQRVPWELGRLSWWRRWSLLWPEFIEPVSGWEGLDEFAGWDLRSELPWDGGFWRVRSTRLIDQAAHSGSVEALITGLVWVAKARIALGNRSQDSVTRELSRSFDLQNDGGTSADVGLGDPIARAQSDALDLPRGYSTVIHGTRAWKGGWWYPSGDFHAHVKRNLRPQLYDGGMEFSWSGALNGNHRKIAGDRFVRWAEGTPSSRLDAVFAHSYGGEVAARAINLGAAVRDLVLLSVPVNLHQSRALDAVNRVIDVRLEFDLVLALALTTTQRMPQHLNLTEYRLAKQYWSHGASHDPRVWKSEDIAAKVKL